MSRREGSVNLDPGGCDDPAAAGLGRSRAFSFHRALIVGRDTPARDGPRRQHAQRLVTVFGGPGFIGRHVVRRLAARGARSACPAAIRRAALFLQADGRRRPDRDRAADPAGDGERSRAGRGRARGRQPDRHPVREPGGRLRPGPGPSCRARSARAAAAAGRRRGWCRSRRSAPTRSSTSAYARTKAEGEAAVREAFPRRHDPAPEHRVRPRGRLLQPLRARWPAARRRCR